MYVEFEGADGVGDILDGVALSVGVVVHRVDVPFVAGAVVFGVQYAVHDGVAELHVGVSHVYLGAEHLGAVGELAVFHAFEQFEVFLYAAVAVGTFNAGSCHCAAVFAYVVERLVVDVGQTFLNQHLSPFV